MKPKTPRSLKSRALQLLAQREQSRVELRRKLLSHALAEDAARAAADVAATGASLASDAVALDAFALAAAMGEGRAPDKGAGVEAAPGTVAKDAVGADALAPGAFARWRADSDAVATVSDAASRVDEVLAWLGAHRFVSDERFAESRINARAGRFGDLRIRQELKQHGVALDADAARALRESEGSRAWAVWERRFGSAAPATGAESARQARFLTARGFSPDTVRQVLRQARALQRAPDASVVED